MLSTIHTELMNNPDVFIVEHLDTKRLPDPGDKPGHEVHFWVIPMNDETMTDEELAEMRKSLISLEPSHIDEYEMWGHDMAELRFDEERGVRSIRSEIVISDERLGSAKEHTDDTEKIQRQVRVILFPDKETVQCARRMLGGMRLMAVD